MGRRIRSDIPHVEDNLMPKWEHIKNFRQLDTKYKKSQKDNYDRHHRVRTLPMLLISRLCGLKPEDIRFRDVYSNQLTHLAHT